MTIHAIDWPDSSGQPEHGDRWECLCGVSGIAGGVGVSANEHVATAGMPGATMTPEKAAALRAEFPPEHIGKLPKITCRDCSDSHKTCQKHQKAKCKVCEAWISTAHIHIDFVGHGATTDRLLEVDPEWNWEPLAFEQNGLPLFAYNKQMEPVSFWIRLTICGVTRLGVGSCPDGQFDAEKVLIGDALRNAAMRFGVALDLWIKGHAEDDERATATNQRSRLADTANPEKIATILATVNGLDEDTRDRVRGWVQSKGFPDHPRKLNDPQADQVLAYLESITAQHDEQETA